MKIWLFALLQSIIASLGCAAFFFADNIYLATSAAVLAALLGVAQPLLSAHKGRKLKAYQERQWKQSLKTVDDQLDELVEGVIDPPFPHRATIVRAIEHRFGRRASDLIDRYDQLVSSIQARSHESETLVAPFADEVKPWSVGPYLEGLVAWRAGDVGTAYQRFCVAKELQENWILPWLGWASAAYRRGSWNEIRKAHPHVCGVELLPYDAGDDTTFLGLSDDERADLTNRFQCAAKSLGEYYTIAEFSHSKQQMATSHEAYNKVA